MTSGQQHLRALGHELREDLAQMRTEGRVQTCERVVDQQQLGVPAKRAPEDELALLAARELQPTPIQQWREAQSRDGRSTARHMRRALARVVIQPEGAQMLDVVVGQKL